MSTVLTAALLFKSSFVGAGLKREFIKARIFKIASIYGSYLRAGVIREAAVNTVDTVLKNHDLIKNNLNSDATIC